jgi:predicted SnoaL-like aldol condensation-catalyzing enzyme
MHLKEGIGELVDLLVEEIWNRGEIEMADALFTDDYVNHGGLIPDLLRGPEAVKLSVALYRSAFPNFQIAVDEITTDNDAIVLRWVAHSGPPLMDGPAPRKGGLRGITRCRLRDGQIAESWTVWNSRIAILEWTPRGKRRTDVPVNHIDSRKPRRAHRTDG